MRDWRDLLYYRKECVKTTWKLRIAVVAVVILTAVATHGFLASYIGWSLVCTQDLTPSDAILVENFDPDYLLFERAAALEKAGLAPRILVPVQVLPDLEVANLVSTGVAEVMARQARIAIWDVIPIREIEPISLNAASQIGEHLVREHIRSLIVVAPGFRSRRSALVYGAVLGRLGVQVRCEPVIRRGAPDRWRATWHGVQTVVQEYFKLQYYRFYVLPFYVVNNGGRT